MADATPSRLGFINAASDGSFEQDNALFLKVFAGEVLAAYRKRKIMAGRVRTRTITHGKSAQFPVTGRATASRHTPGDQLLGANKIKHGEKVINIDDLLVSDTFIANIDEAKNHYDVREIYTGELGEAIANTDDAQLLQLTILAARASANYTGGEGGTQVWNANALTDAATLASLVKDAKVALEEKRMNDTPLGVFRPTQYHLLAAHPEAINADYDGAGSISKGTIKMLHGVELERSLNFPRTDISANDGENNSYDGDFSDSAGSVFGRNAIGTVQLMSMQTEMEYQISRQGTLVVAKLANGSGILRPEDAVEIAAADPS